MVEPNRLGIRINPEIGVMQAVNAVILLLGLAMGAQAYFSKTNSNETEIRTLKADVATQFASQKSDMTAQIAAQKVDVTSQYTALQLSMNDQFKGLRLDIANLPDVRAELVQLGRRADQSDSRSNAQSDRMEKLETLLIQLQARVDNSIPRQIRGSH